MDLETGTFDYKKKKLSWRGVLVLSYQSFGVVYGDLSISPLYVYKSLFSEEVKLSDNDVEILGILSFIFWTFTIIPLVKYVLIVHRADDSGEGGTFALYSLLCRHANLSFLPNRQAVDEELSTYTLEKAPETKRSSYVKRFLEKKQYNQALLLITVLLGTCMLIGDGVMTPTISVLSAVSGVKVAVKDLHERVVVLIACAILVGLFALQHHGTRKVGFLFAPIVIAWLLCIGGIGVYNIIHWNPGVVKALSPMSMYRFFKATGIDGWVALGGVVLCITGTEAMFADLGHFSELSIRVAFICIVYPCMILGYMGQAAFLSRNHNAIEGSFYLSIPKPVFWPVFVIATLASVVGSQAVISATFSIVKQCSSLGCFPRVKIIHTSKHIYGQIYIPEINWILMLLCLAVTIGFRDTVFIGHAYGLAVITVMLVTTFLTSLVILVVWHKSGFLALAFFLFFGSIEVFYILASLIKVPEGGWLPLALAMVFMVTMYSWHYGVRKKYEYDLQNKVSMKWLLTLGPSLGMVRVPGIGLIYTELVSGVPAIFSHFVTNLPAFHRFLVFVCVKSVPVPHVPPEERFLVGRIGPKEYRMYRCIVRYGYKDIRNDDHAFENQLVLNLAEFIQTSGDDTSPNFSDASLEGKMTVIGTPTGSSLRLLDADTYNHINNNNSSIRSLSLSPTIQSFEDMEEQDCLSSGKRRRVRFELPNSIDFDPAIREELMELIQAKDAGVTYILGHSYVKAKSGSSLTKKFAINVVYSFLRKNCRSPSMALNIPHICLLEVGMIYYV